MNASSPHFAHLEKVRRLFDYWAEGGYAETMERDYGPIAKYAFDLLQVRPRYRFLDVGCGNGYAVRCAADLGALAFGIDGSPRMIERAKWASKKHPKAEFRRAFFPADFLKRKSYDSILGIESLYYMPDVAAALKSMYELLVPGGGFAFAITYYWENQESHGWPQQSGVPMVMLSESQWGQALASAGFVVLSKDRVPHPAAVQSGSLVFSGRRPS